MSRLGGAIESEGEGDREGQIKTNKLKFAENFSRLSLSLSLEARFGAERISAGVTVLRNLVTALRAQKLASPRDANAKRARDRVTAF